MKTSQNIVTHYFFLLAAGRPSITQNRGVFRGLGAAFELRRAHGFGRDDVSRRGFSAGGSFMAVGFSRYQSSQERAVLAHTAFLARSRLCTALPLFGRVRLRVQR
jgi:hypothetical protein